MSLFSSTDKLNASLTLFCETIIDGELEKERDRDNNLAGRFASGEKMCQNRILLLDILIAFHLTPQRLLMIAAWRRRSREARDHLDRHRMPRRGRRAPTSW